MMPGQPPQDRDWDDLLGVSLDPRSGDYRAVPGRTPADVYDGLAQAIGGGRARGGLAGDEVQGMVHDLREQMGL